MNLTDLAANSLAAIRTEPIPRVLDPFRLLLIAVAGWMNHHQLQRIDYLREENRVLRELLGARRVRLGGMLNYYYRAA